MRREYHWAVTESKRELIYRAYHHAINGSLNPAHELDGKPPGRAVQKLMRIYPEAEIIRGKSRRYPMIIVKFPEVKK